jgi:hypothetical protein
LDTSQPNTSRIGLGVASHTEEEKEEERKKELLLKELETQLEIENR